MQVRKMSRIIDGNAIAEAIIEELTAEVNGFPKILPPPKVTFVRVGDDPASVSYVNKKQKTAERIGIASTVQILDPGIFQDELIGEIQTLNRDSSVHGILVQAPLPDAIEERVIFNTVDPDKDIDGLNTINTGRIAQEDPLGFAACTPSGIIEILERTGVETEGRHAVILGRSILVGKPLALLLMQKKKSANATVTLCHSRSRQLADLARQADILIAAIGRPHFVGADMVKPGAVVIDVGINRVEAPERKRGYRLVGDVDFEAVAPLADRITPVPGGVGPMTVAMLMKNTVRAYRKAVGA